jgi:arginine transport system substrate-binding protein
MRAASRIRKPTRLKTIFLIDVFGEMTMKKVLIAALLAGVSLSATAAQTIRFATEASYPPFESIDANNKIVGFDVDLANALCKEIDATCTFTNQAFDSLIPSLKFRRFDAVMAGMDITPEREKQVLFTTPYYDNSALFVGQKGKFTSIDQLKGKKWACRTAPRTRNSSWINIRKSPPFRTTATRMRSWICRMAVSTAYLVIPPW